MTQGPATPSPVSLHDALGSAPSLARLRSRLQAGAQVLALVRPALPAGLRDDVTVVPHEDQGWTLVAPNPAAAAKLRQLLPTIRQMLAAAGQANVSVRIHVRKRAGASGP